MTKKEQIQKVIDEIVEMYKKSGAKVEIRSNSYGDDDTGDIELDIVTSSKNRITSCIEWDDELCPNALDLYWISPSGGRSIYKDDNWFSLPELLAEFKRDMEILLEKY